MPCPFLLKRSARLSPVGDTEARTVTGARVILTNRQHEVLRLLAEGLTNRQIGAHLFISPDTAKFHVAGVLAALDVHTRGAAAFEARRIGLLT